ncbi:hypothetical protein NDU88_003430 [Pleurodeles waltl]|uniref:Uncharacterized protein n=1 Tax=Pleurodeles waltl TaxID=8319 RepID=A0AAV7MRS8_PLEWA|nr:hypothetical protein NDU88_003430 [Pleurodeles waltl]
MYFPSTRTMKTLTGEEDATFLIPAEPDDENTGVILTLADGGGRPPRYRRQNTAPRSKDRGGDSDICPVLAGGRQKTARQHRANQPSH